jgi:hypothetical protein
MPTEPHTPTLAEVVRVACEAADPNGSDDLVTQFLSRFEDRDEPISAIDDVEEELVEAHRIVDLDGDSEPLRNAVAVAVYLAFRRDEIDSDPDDLIRRANAAEDSV